MKSPKRRPERTFLTDSGTPEGSPVDLVTHSASKRPMQDHEFLRGRARDLRAQAERTADPVIAGKLKELAHEFDAEAEMIAGSEDPTSDSSG